MVAVSGVWANTAAAKRKRHEPRSLNIGVRVIQQGYSTPPATTTDRRGFGGAAVAPVNNRRAACQAAPHSGKRCRRFSEARSGASQRSRRIANPPQVNNPQEFVAACGETDKQ